MDAETVLMAHEEPPMPRQRKQPEEVLMKIVLVTTQSHFESPGILPERTVSVVLNSGKKLLEKSQRNAEDRYEGSTSPELL